MRLAQKKNHFSSNLLRKWAPALLAATLTSPLPALAAGGHHAVDDAGILDAGACKVDGWLASGRGNTGLLQTGAGCRVGPVELGVGLGRGRDGSDRATGYGLQAKWATEVTRGVGVGLSVAAGWQRGASPSYQGMTVTGLYTLQASDSVRVHLNLGRAFVYQGADETVGGLSVDWTFREGWQVMAERYRADGGHFARVGLRWTPAKGWVLDASRSHRISGDGASAWTLGFTREFD